MRRSSGTDGYLTTDQDVPGARITQAVDRMRELIDGLLSLARLSHQPLTYQNVDLSDLAKEAFELLRIRDSTRAVEFICEPSAPVCADRTAASIVISNLIENAWKYSSRAEVARIEFGQEALTEGATYFVRDNGIGFDMEHARHLFEPFCRLHGSGEFAGSGVGLATVARVIKRHEGRIWAVSEPGKGATFYFTLNPPAHS